MNYTKFLIIILFLFSHDVQSIVRFKKKIATRDDILLIINFNYPHYELVNFLKELYSPYFAHIVFYGPTKHKDVELCDHHNGWFSYKGIADAMEKFPGFAGYLWIHDDLIINPWNLGRFDVNKVWKTTAAPLDLKLGLQAITGWTWWPLDVGYSAIQKVYDELDPKYKNNLVANRGEHKVAFGYSDIVYIPSSYVHDFIILCQLCSKHRVFLEIALPTICAAIAGKDETENFNGLAVWLSTYTESLDHYNRQIDFLHSLKCSIDVIRLFVKKEFAIAAQGYDC